MSNFNTIVPSDTILSRVAMFITVNRIVEQAIQDCVGSDIVLFDKEFYPFDEGSVVLLRYYQSEGDYRYDIKIVFHHGETKTAPVTKIGVLWEIDGQPVEPPEGFPEF